MRRDPITHAPLGPFTPEELADMQRYCRATEKLQRPMVRRLKLILFLAAICQPKFRRWAIAALAAGAIIGVIWHR